MAKRENSRSLAADLSPTLQSVAPLQDLEGTLFRGSLRNVAPFE